MKVGIIGLGLIGGSLARDLSGLDWAVAGHDRDPRSLLAAARAGVIAARLPLGPENDAGRGLPTTPIHDLDLLVLALPTPAAAETLREASVWMDPQNRSTGAASGGPDGGPGGSAAGPVVTDVGSTKRSIVRAAEAAGLAPRFVGGHPVAGHHQSGWSASRPGLFRHARVWLCPASDAPAAAVERVARLWRAVDAYPATIDPLEHDRRLAHASHLPQLTATTLARAMSAAGITPADLGPGGRDATRLAASDPELWTEILLDNSDEVRPALQRLTAALREMEDALAVGDETRLRALFGEGRVWSETRGNGRTTGAGH